MSRTRKKSGAPPIEAPRETTEAPESTGTRYVCISAHDQYVRRSDGVRGYISRPVGTVAVFEKDPGPSWRPENEITKPEEVTEDGTAD